MGFSGLRGKVYYVDQNCVDLECGTNLTFPSGSAVCWFDEVTRFTVVDSVQIKGYGHDKSQGWEDQVAGNRKYEISLDCVKRPNANPLNPHAGKVVFLELFQGNDGDGGCDKPAKGFAIIKQISRTVDQETGAPVAYTLSMTSKGPWTPFGSSSNTGQLWGGFECDCGGSTNAGSAGD